MGEVITFFFYFAALWGLFYMLAAATRYKYKNILLASIFSFLMTVSMMSNERLQNENKVAENKIKTLLTDSNAKE